jgi:hypothetical protein
MSDHKDLYFLVEGGKPLELAKAHVAAASDTHARNWELAKELDATRFCTSLQDGAIIGVVFEGERHPDFAKPNKYGTCFPKKKTEWLRRFEENKGYDKQGNEIAKALGIPTTMGYTTPDGGDGWTVFGTGFNSGTGFLWLSSDGPFCLYIPDIPEKVARYEADGYTVNDDVKNFKPEFEGARPILKEEWELMVAQHKVAKLRGEAA